MSSTFYTSSNVSLKRDENKNYWDVIAETFF